MPGSAPAMCEDRSANGHVPNPTSEVSEVLGRGQIGQEGHVLHEKVLLGGTMRALPCPNEQRGWQRQHTPSLSVDRRPSLKTLSLSSQPASGGHHFVERALFERERDVFIAAVLSDGMPGLGGTELNSVSVLRPNTRRSRGRADLFDVREDLCLRALDLNLAEHRQGDASENGDDRDHDEQFDEGEGGLSFGR